MTDQPPANGSHSGPVPSPNEAPTEPLAAVPNADENPTVPLPEQPGTDATLPLPPATPVPPPNTTASQPGSTMLDPAAAPPPAWSAPAAAGRPPYVAPANQAQPAPAGYPPTAYAPAYQQPAYAQSAYQPVGAGTPGYQPAWQTPQPPQPPKKNRTPAIVLALIGALILALAATLGALTLPGLLPGDPSVSRPTLPAPSSPTPTPSQTPTTPGQTTEPRANAAQSRGLVLIFSTLPGGTAAGTGLIISADGYILTNYHVVEGTTAITVTVVSSDREYTARFVGRARNDDVALIKVDATGLDTVATRTEAPGVGLNVFAVGNAGGQGYLTSAAGRVTALNQSIQVRKDSGETQTLQNMIQTTAAAQPGDSGGATMDEQNRVLGITSAGQQRVTGGQTVTVASYAIPIARAMNVADQIRNNQASPQIQIGPKAYLGISMANNSDAPTVASVVAGGPAAQAGIQVGDTIVSVGSTQTPTNTALREALSLLPPNTATTITWRTAGGEQRSGSVTLTASPYN